MATRAAGCGRERRFAWAVEALHVFPYAINGSSMKAPTGGSPAAAEATQFATEFEPAQ